MCTALVILYGYNEAALNVDGTARMMKLYLSLKMDGGVRKSAGMEKGKK